MSWVSYDNPPPPLTQASCSISALSRKSTPPRQSSRMNRRSPRQRDADRFEAKLSDGRPVPDGEKKRHEPSSSSGSSWLRPAARITLTARICRQAEVEWMLLHDASIPARDPNRTLVH